MADAGLVVMAYGRTWEAIEGVVESRDAELVACGTSRSGLKGELPGNLADSLVERCSRPVLVVPSPKAAAERRRG